MHGFNLVLEGVRQIRGTSTSPGRRTPTCRSSRAAKASRPPRSSSRRSGRDGDRLAAPRSRASPTSGAVLGGHRARRAARAGVRRRAAARRMPPRPMCPHCRSTDVHVGADERAAGAIWSFIVPHPPLLPAYAEFAPYNAIIVELDEDPMIRFVGNLVDRAPTARSTRSIPRRSRSANRCASCSTRSTTCSSPAGCAREGHVSARSRRCRRLPDQGREHAAHARRSARGIRTRVQPLVRTRPLLRGLHDRPVALRGQPLGCDARAQGRALARGRRDDREPTRRRLVRRDLLRRAGSPRRPLLHLGPTAGERALRRGPRLPRTPPHPHRPVRPPRRRVPRRRSGSRRARTRPRLRRHRPALVRRHRPRRAPAP